MRAVALSDAEIQQTINGSCVPLKIIMTYPPKMAAFPLDWPAMKNWQRAYQVTGGAGFTGCSVVSPDLQTQYGSTGSAMVWELFDSTAYDAEKFKKMLTQSLEFANEESEILRTKPRGQRLKLAKFRAKVFRENHSHMRLPPNGFSVEKAKELFRKTGDLKEGQSQKKTRTNN